MSVTDSREKKPGSIKFRWLLLFSFVVSFAITALANPHPVRFGAVDPDDLIYLSEGVDDIAATLDSDITTVSNMVVVVTNGLASTNWVLEQKYVTEAVTNGLASEEWVLGKEYVTKSVTNGLAGEEWVLGKHYVTKAVTNGLASTNWVLGQKYVTEAITNGLASTNWVLGQKYVTKAVTNELSDRIFDADGYVMTNLVRTSSLLDEAVTKEKIDGSVTNWLATTNWVTDIVSKATPGNYNEVSNRAMNSVQVEIDPVFTNWVATTNYVWYSGDHGEELLFDRDGNELFDFNAHKDVVVYGSDPDPGLFYNGTNILELEKVPAFEPVEGSAAYVLSNKLDGSVTRFEDFARIYSTGQHIAISNAEYSVKPVLWDRLNGYNAISFGGTSYDYVVEGWTNQVYDLPNQPYTLYLRYGPLNVAPVGGNYSSSEGLSLRYADTTFYPVTGEWPYHDGNRLSVPYLDLKGNKFTPISAYYLADSGNNGFSITVPLRDGGDVPTNTVSFYMYPNKYLYFDHDLENDLLLVNYNGQSFNLTHPVVDYVSITNASDHIRIKNQNSQWGEWYTYTLPTNAVDGTWVLARTNDIPAYVESGVAAAISATNFVSGYAYSPYYPYSDTNIVLNVPIQNSNGIYTWMVSPDIIVRYGSLGPDDYGLSAKGFSLSTIHPSFQYIAFTNNAGSGLYDFEKYDRAMGSFNYFKLPDARPYSSDTHNVHTLITDTTLENDLIDLGWVPYFDSMDSYISNRITHQTYDLDNVPYFVNPQMDYGLVTNRMAGKSYDLDRLLVGRQRYEYETFYATNDVYDLNFNVNGGKLYSGFDDHGYFYLDDLFLSNSGMMDGLFGTRFLTWKTNGVLKAGTVATVEDLAGFANYQDVTNTVKAITNLADRIVSGSNEAYVNSSGVYYKHPNGYGLPATLSFNTDAEYVKVGEEMFPSNYTVVINPPGVTSLEAPPVPIYGISTDGKWELSTAAGDGVTGWINHIEGGEAAPVFRITGFTGNNFSIVLDTSVLVVPDPNATLTRSTVFASDKLTTESFVYDLNSRNAKPDIDYENSVLQLTWGSGALSGAYLPYYNDPSEFPKVPQGVITTNGNGSVNVSRVSSNSVSGNDNFVFGNNNSVFGDNVTVFGNGNLVTNSSGAAVLGQSGHTVKDSPSSIVSGNGYNNLESSPCSIITGVGGTTAVNSGSSFVLSGGGGGVNNSPNATFLAPTGTSVYDSQNIIIGGYHHNVVSNAPYSVVLGGTTVVTNQYVFMWNGGYNQYADHGQRTFNINPVGGIEGFWIGDKNLATYLGSIDNVLYKSTTIDGSESAFQSLKYYDLLDTFVGSRRANRYVSLYGALYVGEKADLVSTAFDPNPGGFTLSVGRGNTEAKGRSSVALGNNVTTADDDSFVTGYGGKVTGKIGFASGKNTRAKGNVSTATGEGTTAAGYASSSSGWFTLASAGTSQAHGKYVSAKDSDSWAWSAGFDSTSAPRASLWTAEHADNIQSLTNGFYESHGPGTFNVDPIGGTEGFWIGETNLAEHIGTVATNIARQLIRDAVSDISVDIQTAQDTRATLTNLITRLKNL